MARRRSSSANALFGWVRRRSLAVKLLLSLAVSIFIIVALMSLFRDRDLFFVASEAVHALGIMVLIYKLTTKKTCSGLSQKTQVATAIYLAARVYCSFFMEADIHTVLDSATLLATIWVIYMMLFKLKATYVKELDNLPLYYMVVPAAILALFIHPYAGYILAYRMLWAFSAYMETISMLPQLRLMQNAKMIELFTSHYMFALGVARFLGCAHWIVQIYETGGRYLLLAGSGYLWLPMVLICEVIQTFILADFCYYYVKSVVDGQLIIIRLPSVV